MGSYIFEDLNRDFLFNTIQFYGDATINLDPSTPSGVLTFDCNIVGQNATFTSLTHLSSTVTHLVVTGTLAAPSAPNVTIAGTPLDTFTQTTARAALSASTPVQYTPATGVIAFDVNTTSLTQYVPITRQVIAGTGLTGGGTLSTDVTLNVDGSHITGLFTATPPVTYSSGTIGFDVNTTALTQYVTLTTTQSISGAKTFTSDVDISKTDASLTTTDAGGGVSFLKTTSLADKGKN